MIRPRKGEAYVFSRVVLTARDVVKVEIKCTMVADTDPTITLRSNWSCLSQRIWSEFGEGMRHWAELSLSEDTTLSHRQSQVNHTQIGET